MKSIKYITALAITALVLLYYFNNDSSAEINKVKPINQVSLQSTSANTQTKPTKTKQQSKTTKADPNDLIEEIINNDVEAEKKPDPSLDYVTAYRDWKYFPNCFTDIEDFQNERDPLQTLADRFENNPRENQTEPTPQQNIYYQQHVDICKTLIDDVSDQETDDYYQILSKLERRFNSITPKTEKAKQLQHALKMVTQLKDFQRNYRDATFPVSNLTTEQQDVITQRIQTLTSTIIQIYEGNTELTEQDTQQINQLSDEVESLRKEMVNNSSINQENMQDRMQQTDGFLNSIDDYMHKIQSPDAFIVLSTELYNPEYYQKDSNVIKRMKAQTGIQDDYYIRILNKLVTPLVACTMDYPCDAESDYMMSYCLGLRDSMFNQACGSTLEDFYFNFYVGNNQMNDVVTYFNFLVNRYAQ